MRGGYLKVITYTLKRQRIRINVVQTEQDLAGFYEFVSSNPVMGFDTETTGLDWWNAGDGFRCRLVQFGNADEAWVIPVELGAPYVDAVTWAVHKAERLAAHNRGFDIHVLESCFGISAEVLVRKTFCTKTLAHLVDSRARKEGGPGLKLEELVPHYICAETGEKVKKSMTEIARRYKVKKTEIWSVVELFDDEFSLYAGMDPVFAFRLLNILLPKIPARSRRQGLIGWEHRLHWVTYQMERTGYLVDEEYTRQRIDELTKEEADWKAVAAQYGVDSIGSTPQLVEAFTGLGFKLTKRTKPSKNHPEGQWSMDDSVLKGIDHPLSEAIIKAKAAHKKRTTWFEAALKGRDKNGRVHVTINSCQARSARMTVTGAIAAQTLPAGTGYVRHSFLAEEGHVTVTVDYASMELMFLAADSGDRRMLQAYKQGEDLHDITAAAAFGPIPEGETHHPKRKAGKGTNYTVCFGGGWRAVSEQWDIGEGDAKKAVRGFWATYPATRRLSDQCTQEARKDGFIYTVTGRRILTDPKRPYAAMNYRIQSSCRDIMARAVIKLHEAGFTPWMRLVIHDEIVFSFPEERAEGLAEKAARIMEFTYKGLLIPADAEIGDRSWGSVLETGESKH
ncbi:DNA polymerase I, thermostable [Streptomyces sp. YIM 121038]|uniref:DNA polymerase n=1 Tax=Streptomyces sp. YIM 121038 TaxID=2136401 RepID=UPI001164F101|nr:DNA polymerase [Streptomyces sp. YIM 121038]QCX75691.1 DNA polymerase I, thermostable [Streptomyces sp. YIM 121038]